MCLYRWRSPSELLHFKLLGRSLKQNSTKKYLLHKDSGVFYKGVEFLDPSAIQPLIQFRLTHINTFELLVTIKTSDIRDVEDIRDENYMKNFKCFSAIWTMIFNPRTLSSLSKSFIIWICGYCCMPHTLSQTFWNHASIRAYHLIETRNIPQGSAFISLLNNRLNSLCVKEYKKTPVDFFQMKDICYTIFREIRFAFFTFFQWYLQFKWTVQKIIFEGKNVGKNAFIYHSGHVH